MSEPSGYIVRWVRVDENKKLPSRVFLNMTFFLGWGSASFKDSANLIFFTTGRPSALAPRPADALAIPMAAADVPPWLLAPPDADPAGEPTDSVGRAISTVLRAVGATALSVTITGRRALGVGLAACESDHARRCA